MTRTVQVQISDGPEVLCVCSQDTAIHLGDLCIVDVDRVLEFGRVLRIDDAAAPAPSVGQARLLRQATLQDQAKAHENTVVSKMAVRSCVQAAEKLKLDLNFVRVRYSFDRSVLTVVFVSEERVDFRQMIRDLSVDLHARIEMKQIGVRDEAAIMGGVAACGRSLCCCSWLQKFESINVKMAKVQRLSLNPATIGGMCGRLKCCLKYEYDVYRDMDRSLPCDGAEVRTPEGNGWVIDKDIPRQVVRVRLADQRILTFPAAQVQSARVVHKSEETLQESETSDVIPGGK